MTFLVNIKTGKITTLSSTNKHYDNQGNAAQHYHFHYYHNHHHCHRYHHFHGKDENYQYSDDRGSAAAVHAEEAGVGGKVNYFVE